MVVLICEDTPQVVSSIVLLSDPPLLYFDVQTIHRFLDEAVQNAF